MPDVYVKCFPLGAVGGFFISGAFRGVPQQLVSPPSGDVPSGGLCLSLQLPWRVRLSVRLSCRHQPVHVPRLHCPLLGLSSHGAAAGSWSRQPRTLPLRLCSNVHLLLQERLGQSQGVCQQSAARPPCIIPASVRRWFSVRQRDAPRWGIHCLPAQP